MLIHFVYHVCCKVRYGYKTFLYIIFLILSGCVWFFQEPERTAWAESSQNTACSTSIPASPHDFRQNEADQAESDSDGDADSSGLHDEHPSPPSDGDSDIHSEESDANSDVDSELNSNFLETLEFQPLYEGSKIDVNTTIGSILDFYISPSLSKLALSDLLSLIDNILPQPNLLPHTKYKMDQFIMLNAPSAEHIKHFYCSTYQNYIGVLEDDAPCSICGSENA